MFKSGDKVRVISCKEDHWWYSDKIGEVFVLSSRSASQGWHVEGKSYVWLAESDIELVEEKPQFDLKKNPWFIRTGTKEKSEAAQKWLFEQGIYWCTGKEIMGINEEYLVNTCNNGDVQGYVMWCSESSPHASAKEIIMEFETTVKSVTYPSIETESAKKAQDKKIKELQQTIEKAQKQIEELKNMNS